MRVAVAFDHRGVKLRERVLHELQERGDELVDLGTDTAATPGPTVERDFVAWEDVVRVDGEGGRIVVRESASQA